MSQKPEDLLPSDILAKASLRGNEYAWKIEDIPFVIEAARTAGLVSLGGQLQFRLPDTTCECYWVDINVSLSDSLPWPDRVNASAALAASSYQALRIRFDFMNEGQNSFRSVLESFEANGGKIQEAMCFVWYFASTPK